MNIRYALDTDEDWVEVFDKVDAFNDQYFDIPVDIKRLNKWYHQHLENGIIVLSETGIISGLFVDDPVRDWKVLVETSWYDTGRSGLRLLRHFIKVGRVAKVDEVRMTTLNTTPPRVKALLKRMGFEEIEQSHRLTL